MQESPQKFQVFLPPTHERFPVTGVFTGFLTVGIWYSCTSQHMVQRVLGAKDEWHARMGVVGAGYLRIITPFFFVLPGIIAFKLFPNLPRQDMAYLALVKELIPTGLRGLILAGMAAALMSNVSSVLNSASTLATMDLYGKLIRPQASEKELVTVRPHQRRRHPDRQHADRLLLQPAGRVALRAASAHFLLHRAAVRGDLHARPALAPRQRHGRGVDDRPRLRLHGVPRLLRVSAHRLAAAVQDLSAPGALRVDLLHGRDDRRLAADRAAAAGEDRRHHLEPAATPSCRRSCGGNTAGGRITASGGPGSCCRSWRSTGSSSGSSSCDNSAHSTDANISPSSLSPIVRFSGSVTTCFFPSYFVPSGM